ncbi:MAG TPA: hypothetical protein VHE78_16910 [Gemmatimonadaceae bacterium]|nr:hypothetical protein [Gemmatimonadaceae bacterium]
MRTLERALSVGSLLSTLALAPGLAAQAADPNIGTWKLNVAKSTYDPGPGPKSMTITIEAAGQARKNTLSGVDPEGKPIRVTYTANYDGKDYPATGSAAYDMVSLKRIDANTSEITRKKDGKVVQTYVLVVTKDGKSLTSTMTGINAKGEKIHSVAVFEKQ